MEDIIKRYGPDVSVPVVPCRGCGVMRPDDGSKCQRAGCGMYQNVRVQPELRRHESVLVGDIQ